MIRGWLRTRYRLDWRSRHRLADPPKGLNESGQTRMLGKDESLLQTYHQLFYEMLVGRTIHSLNSQITGQKNVAFCKGISNLLRFSSQSSLNRVYEDKAKEKATKSSYKKDCLNASSPGPRDHLNRCRWEITFQSELMTKRSGSHCSVIRKEWVLLAPFQTSRFVILIQCPPSPWHLLKDTVTDQDSLPYGNPSARGTNAIITHYLLTARGRHVPRSRHVSFLCSKASVTRSYTSHIQSGLKTVRKSKFLTTKM